MGNESSGHQMCDFFGQRLHGADFDNIRDLPEPDSDLETSKSTLENTLRWEDDGAPLFETNKPVSELVENIKPRLFDETGVI